MTHDSCVAFGWHCRPVMTLPLARGQRGIEHGCFPDEFARARVDRVHLVVGAGVDQRRAPDRHVAVRAAAPFGEAPILPQQGARVGVERLDVVAAVRHVHHTVVDERRRLLVAHADGVSPDLLEPCDVLFVDLLERTVAPAVQRAPPHEPVAGRRVLEHRVRDGHERGLARLRCRAGRRADGQRYAGESEKRSSHGIPPIRKISRTTSRIPTTRLPLPPARPQVPVPREWRSARVPLPHPADLAARCRPSSRPARRRRPRSRRT
jgi:hypothetical protein